MTDLRKAAEMALEALQVMKAGQHQEEKAYMDKAIEALRTALAHDEQSSIPDFPAPFTKADLDIYAPDSWDDERKQTWIDLQVCQRNKIQLHKYAKQLRELLLAQPEQEPVAWMYPSDLKTFETNETTATAFSIKVGCPEEVSVPLYTAPPKRERKWPNHETYCGTCGACMYKPWVGLTDEEVSRVYSDFWTSHSLNGKMPTPFYADFIREIEKLIKEKNT